MGIFTQVRIEQYGKLFKGIYEVIISNERVR